MNQYVLSLGSNKSSRIDFLRQALVELSQFSQIIKVAPLFENPPLLPPQAPADWYHFFLNTAVIVSTELAPGEFLKQTQKIEQSSGRQGDRKKWAPRSLDIDLIFAKSKNGEWLEQNTSELTIPHPEWKTRNFVLAPLLHLDFTFLKNHRTHKNPLTTLMPILNVTPDSFSERPEDRSYEDLLGHFKNLLEQHPAIIDIGAESTRPGATPVDPDTEWSRLEPFLNFWQTQRNDYPFTRISLDTRHYQTAQRALSYSVSVLNDVSGLESAPMREVAEQYDQVILMHSLSIPADPTTVLLETSSPTSEVKTWALKRIRELSPTLQKKIIFDPGIGFGKTPLQSLNLLQNIESFYELEKPILVGHSRKSFMNLWTQEKFFERDFETLGISAEIYGKVDFLRVHNFSAHQRMNQSLLALRGQS
jgi:2-amino-4-hydroxy-6-hydroxymethyldihydropteridine diphosphokinase / dihydropteroate synthase